MSFPTISKAVLSPSLNEFDLPTFEDENDFAVPMVIAVQPDANGNTGLPATAGVFNEVSKSQVTAKRQLPQLATNKVPCVALMSFDSGGLPVPFKAATATLADAATLAANSTLAVKVTGKFQSAVRVATGSQETIAHGLAVVPSLVLVSVYDDTNAGVLASGFVIAEGTHTSTNLLITVTANAKYKVIAFA